MNELQRTLLATLKTAMENGGPAAAVEVCRTEARTIADAVANAGIDGPDSHRLRNPANAPRQWARAVVDSSAGAKAAAERLRVVDLGDRVGVLRPIGTAEMCVRCHGPAADVRRNLGEALAAAMMGPPQATCGAGCGPRFPRARSEVSAMTLSRRDFVRLTACGAAGGATLMLPRLNRLAAEAAAPGSGRFDLVIAGAGLGGVAAALAALHSGLRVAMTEETDWIGGQLTQQAVPPDEHQWIETHGATRWYRELRAGIRDYYKRYYPLTDEARARAELNPGDGAVSRLCHEPQGGARGPRGAPGPAHRDRPAHAVARACRGCGRRRGRPGPLAHEPQPADGQAAGAGGAVLHRRDRVGRPAAADGNRVRHRVRGPRRHRRAARARAA